MVFTDSIVHNMFSGEWWYMTLTHTICNSMHTKVQEGSYPVDGAPPPKVCQMSCWCTYHNQFTYGHLQPNIMSHVNTHLS